MAPAHLEDWAAELLDGRAGAEVLDEMRAHYASDCSLVSKVSLVRRMVMDATPKKGQRNTHPSYKKALAKLKALEPKQADACAERLRLFLAAPLRTQHYEWRRHRHKDFCFDSPAVDAVFESMRPLPENMDDFHVPGDTFAACAERGRETRMLRNENATNIEDGEGVLDRLAALLKDPGERSISELIIGIAGCSGRRLAEAANQRTAFSAWPRHERGVLFDGQLKKSGLNKFAAYPVPLVGVDASTFLKAVAALHHKQGDIRNLTNEQLTTRYQSNARKVLLALFPEMRKLHELRSFYAAAVFTLYDWERKTFSRVLMYVLGHASMQTFFNYNAMQVEGLPPGAYGTFPVDLTTKKNKASPRGSSP